MPTVEEDVPIAEPAESTCAAPTPSDVLEELTLPPTVQAPEPLPSDTVLGPGGRTAEATPSREGRDIAPRELVKVRDPEPSCRVFSTRPRSSRGEDFRNAPSRWAASPVLVPDCSADSGLCHPIDIISRPSLNGELLKGTVDERQSFGSVRSP